MQKFSLVAQFAGSLSLATPLINKAIQSAVKEGRNWKHGLGTFQLSYRNTPHCTTGETPFFLLFSRVVRDKLPTVIPMRNEEPNQLS